MSTFSDCLRTTQVNINCIAVVLCEKCCFQKNFRIIATKLNLLHYIKKNKKKVEINKVLREMKDQKYSNFCLLVTIQ